MHFGAGRAIIQAPLAPNAGVHLTDAKPARRPGPPM